MLAARLVTHDDPGRILPVDVPVRGTTTGFDEHGSLPGAIGRAKSAVHNETVLLRRRAEGPRMRPPFGSSLTHARRSASAESTNDPKKAQPPTAKQTSCRRVVRAARRVPTTRVTPALDRRPIRIDGFGQPAGHDRPGSPGVGACLCVAATSPPTVPNLLRIHGGDIG